MPIAIAIAEVHTLPTNSLKDSGTSRKFLIFFGNLAIGNEHLKIIHNTQENLFCDKLNGSFENQKELHILGRKYPLTKKFYGTRIFLLLDVI